MTATHEPVKRRTTHWQYRIARVDANGHAVTTLYNGLWQPVAVTDPLGNSVQTRYDALGRPIALVDARGQITTTEYDAVGRVIARTDPLGNILSYTYDRSSFRALGFDQRGQVVERPATPHHPDTRLDARGRLTTFALDFLNRPLETLYSDGSLVTRTYDGLGRVTTLLDGAGTTRTDYDLLGRVLEVALPTGQALTYQYDPMGNRLLMQDPGDGITSYTWDANERLTQIVNPYGEVVTIGYDDLGREVAKEASVGVSAYRDYDAAGRQILLRDVLAGGGLLIYTCAYDPAGNRVRSEEFDSTGWPERQYVASYVYDAADQLVGEQWQAESVVACSLAYDAAGNRTSRVLVGQRTSYTCDAANRLVLVEPVGCDPVTVTYDEAGNVVLINKGGLLTTHTWDSENRLTRIEYSDDTPESYAYSPDGLRRRRTFNPDGSAVVLGGDNVSVELAAGSAPRGVRVLTQVPVPDQPLTVTFDSEASEYRVHLGTNEWGFLDSSKNSAQQVAAALNNTSDLDATALGGGLNSGEGPYHLGGWVDFIWDGANVLQEVDSSGETRAHYTDFPGVWGGLTSQRREGVSHVFAFDPQGNTRLMLGGSQTRSAMFWAFGEHKFGWGMDIAVNPYWYAGEFGCATDRVDGSAPGLPQNTRVNMRRRELATEWGRFLSPDPLWPEDGPNPYPYAGNNPPNRVDPSGTKWSTAGPCPSPAWYGYGIKETHHEGAIDALCDLLKAIHSKGRSGQLASVCPGADVRVLNHLLKWCEQGRIICHGTCLFSKDDMDAPITELFTCGRADHRTPWAELDVFLCSFLFMKPGMAEFERRKRIFKESRPNKRFRPCPPVMEIVLHEIVHLAKPKLVEGTVRRIGRCIATKGVQLALPSAQEVAREATSIRRMQTILTFLNIISSSAPPPDVAEAARGNITSRLASMNPLNMPRNMEQFVQWSAKMYQQGEYDLLRAAYQQASADLASGDPGRAYAGLMAFVDFAGAVASLGAKGPAIHSSAKGPRPPLATELISTAAPGGRGTELQAGSSLALPSPLTEQQALSRLNTVRRSR